MKACFRMLGLSLCLAALCLSASAADGETLTGAQYCFCAEDFSAQERSSLCGILVTQVPPEELALIRLDGRTIRPGDFLPTSALDALCLLPTAQESCDAVFSYQPIYGRALGDKAQLTIRIQSGKNEAPRANAQDLETYKNIANNGTLSGTDPENAPLTYQLVQEPKRGTLELNADGSYVYTPHRNKVGEDSFRFTVTDEAGNVSSPATVRIRILKPSEAMSFADMEGDPSHFEALWLCQQGITGGRCIAGNLCFCPEEPVSRGEFLVMAMELRGLTPDPTLMLSCFDDAASTPAWLQPYLACAMQQGIIRGEVQEGSLVFRPNDPISGQEAAVLLQNMLRLPVSAAAMETDSDGWASGAVQALSEAGIVLCTPRDNLNRREAAELLWSVHPLWSA